MSRSLLWETEGLRGVEVRTVDGYQGREKEVIILSMVRANNIGAMGCNSCDKAIINKELEVVQCLHESESCPEGYFYEWVGPEGQGTLKALAGKAVCRPCHPLCKRCNGYGFHEDGHASGLRAAAGLRARRAA